MAQGGQLATPRSVETKLAVIPPESTPFASFLLISLRENHTCVPPFGVHPLGCPNQRASSIQHPNRSFSQPSETLNLNLNLREAPLPHFPGFAHIYPHLNNFFCKFGCGASAPASHPFNRKSKKIQILAKSSGDLSSIITYYQLLSHNKKLKISQLMTSRSQQHILPDWPRKRLVFCNLKLQTSNFKLTEGADCRTKVVLPRQLGFQASLGISSLGTWVFPTRTSRLIIRTTNYA